MLILTCKFLMDKICHLNHFLKQNLALSYFSVVSILTFLVNSLICNNVIKMSIMIFSL
jgi:hypothetical protein